MRAACTLNDDGIKRLGIAVLQQAISDLGCTSQAERRSAEAFIGRESFDCWCVLAGVNPTAARERLRDVSAKRPRFGSLTTE
jgi:hypothetical protein